MNDEEHKRVLDFVCCSKRLGNQIAEFGVVMDPRLLDEWYRKLETVKDLIYTDPFGPMYCPKSETPDPVKERKWKFAVGDEVERIDGGEWLGMQVGDRSIVIEVAPVANKTWCQIRLAGYAGVYSDFNFKLVRSSDA